MGGEGFCSFLTSKSKQLLENRSGINCKQTGQEGWEGRMEGEGGWSEGGGRVEERQATCLPVLVITLQFSRG